MMAPAAPARKGQPDQESKRRGRPPRPPAAEPRRALRPRRSRPLLHDYYGFSSDSESELEERGRRKLKLVLKLSAAPVKREEPPLPTPRMALVEDRCGSPPSSPASTSYVEDEEDEEGSKEKSEEDEEEEAIKPPKKRRIDGSERSRHQERRNNAPMRSRDSVPVSRTPLPERKTLEAILDKLQKKDTYGVFAEPVNPEELPDYHDVIEHPMDFGTVRKKLARNVYRLFEQFEDDVFLICSNAMQYNAPDTIYFRQAHSIQEIARMKFQKLRDDGISTEKERKNEEKFTSDSCKKQLPQKPTDNGISTENKWKNEEKFRPDSCKKQLPQKPRDDSKSTEHEWKNEENNRSESCRQLPPKPRDNGISTENDSMNEDKKTANSCVKHTLRKSISRTGQEPLSSDVSSVATVVSAGETCTGLSNTQLSGSEPPVAVNGNVDSNSSLGDSKLEKADELPARDSPTKLACKLMLVDENRRATYNLSDQEPLTEHDFIFDIVGSKPNQLVSVECGDEYEYARSLALFAASLGSIAWEIASERIEKALPAGVKYGRGWVGEYEPLPTAVLSLDNHTQHRLGYNSSLCDKGSIATANANSASIHLGHQSHAISKKTASDSNSSLHGIQLESIEQSRTLFNVISKPHPRSAEVSLQQKNEKGSANFVDDSCKAVEQTRKSTSSSSSSVPVDTIPRRTECPEGVASRRLERAASSRNNGHKQVPKPTEGLKTQPGKIVAGMDLGRSSDGNASGSSDTSRSINTMGFISKHPSGMAGGFPSHGDQQQNGNNSTNLIGLSSPVLAQAYNTKKGIDAAKKLFPSYPSTDSERWSISSAAPAQSWITFGPSSESKPTVGNPGFLLLNQTRSASCNSPAWRDPNMAANSGGHVDSKTRTISPSFRQPMQLVGGEPWSNKWGSVVTPQFIATDVSRPHGRTQWQGLTPQNQQNQNKDTLRPDLNIGFQCPESPVRQSSGINLEAQQPDLALQL